MKSECKINLDAQCLVPVFSHQGLVYDQAEYQIVALMTHLGLATLRIAPSLMNTTSPAEWLLAPPSSAWHAPHWMTRCATMFWMVRADCLHLLQDVPRTPMQETAAAHLASAET